MSPPRHIPSVVWPRPPRETGSVRFAWRPCAAAAGLTTLFTRLAAESAAVDHPGHAWFVERFRRMRAAVAGLLAAQQGAGRIRPDVDVQQLSAEIFGIWDGPALQWEL